MYKGMAAELENDFDTISQTVVGIDIDY